MALIDKVISLYFVAQEKGAFQNLFVRMWKELMR